MKIFLISVFSVLFLVLSACGDPLGYRNIEIKNLASRDIKIEGLGFSNNKFFLTSYEGDPSEVIKISRHGMGSSYTGLKKERKFQEMYELKIYYKSKACLLLDLDEKNRELFNKYISSFSEGKVLAITKKGLELLEQEDYENKKGIYAVNDKNVKCIKNDN